MSDTLTRERSAGFPSQDWRHENARGLSLAADGDWGPATDAFETAMEVVAARTDTSSREGLALVLNNLAQACLRSGRVDDAIRHAQRACSLRVALVGEDAIAVARARSDLAVILASADRALEGLALVSRAIAGIEQSAGDDDVRLLTVFENAARLALAAGQPSTAEPYLLRLHALLDAHGMATQTADELLRMVSACRNADTAAQTADLMGHVDEADAGGGKDAVDAAQATDNADNADNADVVDVVDIADVVHAADVTDSLADLESSQGLTAAEVSAEPPALLDGFELYEEHDDQALRDAVALTDVLLRSTPTSVRAVEPADDTMDTERDDIFGGADIEFVDDATTDGQADIVTPESKLDDALDITDDALVDDLTHEAIDTMADSGNGLGFAVEYGAVSTPFEMPVSEDAGHSDIEFVAAADNDAVNEAEHEVVTELETTVDDAPAHVALDFDALFDSVAGAPTDTHTPTDTHAPPASTTSAPSTDAESGVPIGVTPHQPRKKPVIRGGESPSGSQRMKVGGAVAAAVIAGGLWFMFVGR